MIYFNVIDCESEAKSGTKFCEKGGAKFVRIGVKVYEKNNDKFGEKKMRRNKLK